MIQFKSTTGKCKQWTVKTGAERRRGFSNRVKVLPYKRTCVARSFVSKTEWFLLTKNVHWNQCLTWTLEKLSKQIVINCKILPVRKKILPSKLRPSVEIIGKVWTANGKKSFLPDNERCQVLFWASNFNHGKIRKGIYAS